MSILAIRIKKFNLSRVQVLIAEWVLIAVLLMYPIFASISIFLGVNSTPLSITYRIVYLFGALTVILIDLARFPNGGRKISYLVVPLLLFWLIYLFRMVNDLILLDLNVGFTRNHGFLFYFQYGILGSMIPALSLSMISNKINYQRLFNNFRKVAFVTAFSLMYIIHSEVGFNMQMFLMRHGLGEDSGVINPIILGQYGGLITVTFFYCITIKNGSRFVNGIMIFIGLLLLTIGASRGPFLAMFIVLFLLLLEKFKTKVISFKFWLKVMFGFFSLLIIFIQYIIPNLQNISLLNRVQSSVDTGAGLDARGSAYSAAWNHFLKSPVYGDRIIENALNWYPHNFVLEILMASGLLGLLMFLPILFEFSISYFNLINRKIRFFFFIGSLFFLYSMFSLSIISTPQVWCLLMLIGSIKYSISR